VSAKLTNLKLIRDHVEDAARGAGFPDLKVYDLVLAVDEAATNIMMHGYGVSAATAESGGEAGVVEVETNLDDSTLRVTLRDQARPFDLTAAPVQTELPPLGERMPGGLGIFLIRKTMDEIRYRRTPDGWNELTLTVFRPTGPEEG
jgi:serine/threonine-protein kinase RsbW